jgi:hypothetical protein
MGHPHTGAAAAVAASAVTAVNCQQNPPTGHPR